MIRTFKEMSDDNKLDDGYVSFEDNLVFCIVAGDYLRARRRRYPRGLIVEYEEEHFEDGFANECYSPTSSSNLKARFLYKYSVIDDNYIFYIWNAHFEYLEE